jgi:hypothetical protein
MLLAPPAIGQLHQSNVTAAATTGTSITAHASANTKGSYTSLVDPTNEPSYGIWVAFSEASSSAAVANILVDIAYGPTGGGNEEIILPDLNAGAAAEHGTRMGTKFYFFPVYIPDGVALRARCAASTGGDSVLVQTWLLQKPAYEFTCGLVSVYGRDAANSRGTSVTPGSSAFGSWTEMLNAAGGSGLTRPHRFWTMMLDGLADTTLVDDIYEVCELGVGPTGTVTTIGGLWHFGEEGGEVIANTIPLIVHAPVGVDATNEKLWVRMSQTGSTEARGCMVWGMD